jgi:hypothetical protein
MAFNPKTHTAISISALESMGKMVKQLQDERDMLLKSLCGIVDAANKCDQPLGEWAAKPFADARAEIAACQDSKKVME